MKTPRDFAKRPEAEKQDLMRDSWCDTCNQADLGLVTPQEFEEGGDIYVEGICPKCGSTIRTYVVVIQQPSSKAEQNEK